MWTADELGRVRDELVAQLREVEHARIGLVAEVEQSPDGGAGGDRPAFPLDTDDLATHRAEEDVALRVMEVEGHLRAEIVDALARLDHGRYGVCERCGKRIAKERLRALPYARYCVPCARGEKSAPAGGR